MGLMPQYCVGIWSVATESKQWATQPIDLRIRKLLNAIRQFETSATFRAVNTNLANAGQAVTGIFLAPEYLFMEQFEVDGSTPDDGKQTDSYHLGQVLKEVASASRGKRILIIPGTIASQQTLTAEVKRKHVNELQAHLRALGRNTMFTMYTQENIQNQKNAVGASLEKLRAAPTNGSKRAARNTAYGYLGDNQVLEYHKRTEIGEVANDKTIFVNGTQPGLLTLDGKRFGLEVCRDSSQGYLQGLRDTRGLDVQIVLSTDDHNQVKSKYSQFLFMASCATNDSGVYTGPNARVGAAATVRVNGFNLLLHTINVA